MINFREEHNELKELCKNTYKNSNKNIKAWNYIGAYTHNNGFYADLYKKNKSYALIIRGTDTNLGILEAKKDLKSDVQLALKSIPEQAKTGVEVFNDISNKYGKNNIIISGYSLGGSIAEILGTKTGAETVTFSAFGVGNLKNIEINYTDNITNYGNDKDIIFKTNINSQIGHTILLTPNLKTKNPHYLENYGDLEDGIEYQPDNRNLKESAIIKVKKSIGEWANDIDKLIQKVNFEENFFNIKNKIFYNNEKSLQEMTDEEGKQFVSQAYDGKIPTKVELEERVKTGELVYVESYTRADGTKVSGYYRAYPDCA